MARHSLQSFHCTMCNEHSNQQLVSLNCPINDLFWNPKFNGFQNEDPLLDLDLLTFNSLHSSWTAWFWR